MNHKSKSFNKFKQWTFLIIYHWEDGQESKGQQCDRVLLDVV